MISETKIDDTFPTGQFTIEGYCTPFRLDRNADGGGLLIYVREDIPCKKLDTHSEKQNFEGIFFEINLRNKKWLMFGGYNPQKKDIPIFINKLARNLNHYMDRYDNILIFGDFNSQLKETDMKEFCDLYSLKNLINEPTCFKNPQNPSIIDLILTNRPNNFQGSRTIQTGLSGCHKMVITVLKGFFHNKAPRLIKYRDYKKLNQNQFKNELKEKLNLPNKSILNYEKFQEIFMNLLNKHAPMKEKAVRANNAAFMNKTLSKAVMTRSRLQNKYLKFPSKESEVNYKKYRNYCVNLFKREKRKYYNNLSPRNKKRTEKLYYLKMKKFYRMTKKLQRR